MKYIKATTYIFWLIVTILPIIGIVLGLLDSYGFSQAQEYWREKILVFGLFAPVAFVAIQVLQVVITPISHYSIGVVGGFLYGPYLGALLNWLGRVIGHSLAFFIARMFGRRLAEKFVSPDTLAKYDRYVSSGSLTLFLIYFLPLFPDDEVSYLAGLSKMKFNMFFLANIFGQVGGSLGLAYLGSGINTKDSLFWVLTTVTLIGFPLLWWLLRRQSKLSPNETATT